MLPSAAAAATYLPSQMSQMLARLCLRLRACRCRGVSGGNGALGLAERAAAVAAAEKAARSTSGKKRASRG
uniref:Uncharacterized protein n=1 Tax=Arundo donax TaxID=35708 RepID=A0A0A9DRN3_ARUDO